MQWIEFDPNVRTRTNGTHTKIPGGLLDREKVMLYEAEGEICVEAQLAERHVYNKHIQSNYLLGVFDVDWSDYIIGVFDVDWSTLRAMTKGELNGIGINIQESGSGCPES